MILFIILKPGDTMYSFYSTNPSSPLKKKKNWTGWATHNMFDLQVLIDSSLLLQIIGTCGGYTATYNTIIGKMDYSRGKKVGRKPQTLF